MSDGLLTKKTIVKVAALWFEYCVGHIIEGQQLHHVQDS